MPAEQLTDSDFCGVIPQLTDCRSSISKIRYDTDMIFADVHDLYRKERLLHHDISIHNMAFYLKRRRNNPAVIIGLLIDFDLATYPEEAALRFIESKPPLSIELGTDMPHDPVIAPVNASLIPGSVAGGEETLKNGQDRSGTAPFMAVEALDLQSPYYKHHVCHELESIFYASVCPCHPT